MDIYITLKKLSSQEQSLCSVLIDITLIAKYKDYTIFMIIIGDKRTIELQNFEQKDLMEWTRQCNALRTSIYTPLLILKMTNSYHHMTNPNPHISFRSTRSMTFINFLQGPGCH